MPRRSRVSGGPVLVVADPEVERRLLDAVRSGAPLTQAARYAGMSDRTLFRSLARGEDAAARADAGERLSGDDEVCRVLAERVRRAKAEGTVRGVALVQKAAAGGYVVRRTTRSYRDAASGRVVTETVEDLAPVDWKAASWLLSKTMPQDFGSSPQQVEVSGPDGGPVEVADVSSLAARVMSAVAARRAELGGGASPEGPVALPPGSGSVIPGEGSWMP